MPLEAELRSRAYETPLWEELDAQNDRLRKQNEEFFEGVDQNVQEQMRLYRRECTLFLDGIIENGLTAQLKRDNPANLAINNTEASLSSEASEREKRFDQHCEILLAEPTEAIEGMPALRRQVVEAHNRLAPANEQGWSGARLVLSVSLGLVLVAGLGILLETSTNRRTVGKNKGNQDTNDTLPELNRQAELTSLLIQAAADQPVDAARYNVAPERFRAMRQTVVAMVRNLTEEQYWEQLALAAETGYGAEGDPYTLGDHFYALDLAFTLNQPLFAAEPCELDLDGWMKALCEQWQEGESEKPGGGVPRLYRNITTIVNEESGASRLIRLFLARAAVAQVAEQQKKRVLKSGVAGQGLGSGLSWGSFFQISGAAMFCLPPPFMAYGYLANTVLEVLVGSGGNENAFFDGLANALRSMEGTLSQILENQIRLDLQNNIIGPIRTYNRRLKNKFDSLPPSVRDGKSPLAQAPLEYYHNGTHFEEDSDSQLGILKHYFEDELLKVVEQAEMRWDSRTSLDPKGTWCLLLWKLVSITTYLSCSRQLATTYAVIANLSGDTNYTELKDTSWNPGTDAISNRYRPAPSVLLCINGDAKEMSHWTSQHWAQVRMHVGLVISDYQWPESLEGQHHLHNARLIRDSQKGYYDKSWYALIETWRGTESALSRPAEIYRNTLRLWKEASRNWTVDKQSNAFAHGWFTSRRTSPSFCEAYAPDDLLPPHGSADKVGTQEWLLAWFKEMRTLKPEFCLDRQTDEITIKNQVDFIRSSNGIFAIGATRPTWCYFFLQTIRKQLQAWRLVDPNNTINTDGSFNDADRLHAAAWPTTGELSRIVNQLDQAIPCSWEAGSSYLAQVCEALPTRWIEMAQSGADPSRLHWMDQQTYWWLDRRNATQAPMPLLPETIALILEVWLAGAIRADRLQKPIRDAEKDYEAAKLVEYLNNNHCELKALTSQDANSEAYELPADIDTIDRHNNIDCHKSYYDQHRAEIRAAWVAKRYQTLDTLLTEPYGLRPSKPEMGSSEAMVQNWLNGLLDGSMDDNLKLERPDPTKNATAVKMPGLLPPTLGASEWKKGASIQYSYHLRALSQFQQCGNDQTSEESDLSKKVILDDDNVNCGFAISIPIDDMQLARQFVLYRTITSADDPSKTTQTWIGSGSFHPGQIEPSIFHDGNPPVPTKIDQANINVDPSSKPPKGVKGWVKGNKVQYGLQYFDEAGRGLVTKLSELSDPFEISNESCGLKLNIPSDPHGIATAFQVKRQIIGPDGRVVDGLKEFAKHPFPNSNQPGLQWVELLDAELPPAKRSVEFSLTMTTKGLELSRLDQPTVQPVTIWKSYEDIAPPAPLSFCRMQGDGNLVIYDKDHLPHWASNTMEKPGKTDSKQALRLRSNGELAIVESISSDRIVKMLTSADPKLTRDRADVFLRRGETMMINQSLKIADQSP